MASHDFIHFLQPRLVPTLPDLLREDFNDGVAVGSGEERGLLFLSEGEKYTAAGHERRRKKLEYQRRATGDSKPKHPGKRRGGCRLWAKPLAGARGYKPASPKTA
jgi:hypothetical protein